MKSWPTRWAGLSDRASSAHDRPAGFGFGFVSRVGDGVGDDTRAVSRLGAGVVAATEGRIAEGTVAEGAGAGLGPGGGAADGTPPQPGSIPPSATVSAVAASNGLGPRAVFMGSGSS
jgi:hypothetical protein